MAKLFRTSGTGSQQQTLDTTDEKIKIYADDTALDTDLTNIPDGEIVATKESTSGGDSGYVGEIPLGTWASFESDTAPNSEWLQAGTTFDANVYPALAMMLGGNTVPERFDHSRQSEWEEIVSYAARPVSDIFPYTSTKDGLYNTIVTTGENRYVTVNGNIVGQTSTAASNNITFYANKGDIINLTGSGSPYYSLTASYFEHPLFIKATPTSSDSDYEGTLNEIRQYVSKNPDWENAVVITDPFANGQLNYVCPKGGQVMLSDFWSRSSGTIAKMYINDIEVGSGVQGYTSIGAFCVGQGDVITTTDMYTRASTKFVFVPWKTS